MITAPTYQGKTIGIFGLARTGIAAVQALEASGATVWAWDDTPARRLAVGDHAKDLYQADFGKLDALLLAPGVPLTYPQPHALVAKAKAAGTPLISDFDVFQAARADLPPHTCVAITGTNGKSTTTALIGHMVAACGKPVAIGGNIGRGVLSLDPLPEGGIYVFEMSSFQLELTRKFRADVAVMLNLSPDHLDRHGDMQTYAAAKKRIFDMQDSGGVAVIGQDDEYSVAMGHTLSGAIVPVSSQTPLSGGSGISAINGQLAERQADAERPIGSLSAIPTMQGAHNWQNAAAAFAVGRTLGFNQQAILDAFVSFEGLAHRQELIGEVAGVRYINDSKATNVDAASRGLGAFDRLHWIAGGRPKDKSFDALLAHASRIKHAYLLGEAADALAHLCRNQIPYTDCRDMAEAVALAANNAVAGDTVLLSPACTALDQFTDFEARGEAFREAVANLGDAS